MDGVKDHRLVKICEHLNASTYISPQGSHVYIELEKTGGAFADSAISLGYRNYEHPVYPQLHGEFVPYMCILDLIFNLESEAEILEVLRSGRRPLLSSTDLLKLHTNG